MNRTFRQRLIAFVTFIAGLYFFIEFVLPEKIGFVAGFHIFSFQFGHYHEQILLGLMVMGNMAIGLGIINILMVHGRRLLKVQTGWSSSLALLIGMFVMFAVQTTDFFAAENNYTSWKPVSDLEKNVQSSLAALEKEKILSDKSLLIFQKLSEVNQQTSFATFLENSLSELENFQGINFENDKIKFEKLNKELNPAKDNIKEQFKSLELDNFLLNYNNALPEAKLELQNTFSVKAGSFLEALKKLSAICRDFSLLKYENLRVRKIYKLLYEGFFVPLSSSIFALLAFYISYAAYRSFRVKSLEAGIMMFTAIIVILGQIPLPYGETLSALLPEVRLWLLKIINTAGNRAILFGAAIAGLAMSIRMWFSLDRNPLQEDE
ncbi:MAG: hypothetical protein KBC84_02875 [Proteobacteria bacterium]|nr:hypothetical protein [Pseudomonadota bacterium]